MRVLLVTMLRRPRPLFVDFRVVFFIIFVIITFFGLLIYRSQFQGDLAKKLDDEVRKAASLNDEHQVGLDRLYRCYSFDLVHISNAHVFCRRLLGPRTLRWIHWRLKWPSSRRAWFVIGSCCYLEKKNGC